VVFYRVKGGFTLFLEDVKGPPDERKEGDKMGLHIWTCSSFVYSLLPL